MNEVQPRLTPPSRAKELMMPADKCILQYRDKLDEFEAKGWKLDMAAIHAARARGDMAELKRLEEAPLGELPEVYRTVPIYYITNRLTVGAPGSTTANGSDPNSLGSVTIITPASGLNSLITPDDSTWDAGIWNPVSIGDKVWIDANHNGIQDAGEAPVANVTVTIKNGAGVTVATTTTDPTPGSATEPPPRSLRPCRGSNPKRPEPTTTKGPRQAPRDLLQDPTRAPGADPVDASLASQATSHVA